MDYFATDHIIKPEKGDLLISEPYLPDPNFERTVVLLCEHDEEGSFGFVLNKLSKAILPELIEGVDYFEKEIFVGGPVQQNTLHFIHCAPVILSGEKPIGNGIFWGMDFENLIDAITNYQVDSSQLKFFVGYSGWSPGQLMDELKEKSWIVYKNASIDMVFNSSAEELWKMALKDMGGKYRVISNYPTDPRMN